MENIDKSSFSGPGKAFFSGIQTSEALIGNPNTVKKKNQKSNKKIKKLMKIKGEMDPTTRILN